MEQPSQLKKQYAKEHLKACIKNRSLRLKDLVNQQDKELQQIYAKYKEKIETLATKNVSDALKLEKLTGENWQTFIPEDDIQNPPF